MKGNGLKLQICNWKTVYKLPLSTLVLMSPAFSPGRKGPTPANPNPTNINVSCLYCTHKTNSQIVSRRNQRQCRSFAALLDLGLVSLRFLTLQAGWFSTSPIWRVETNPTFSVFKGTPRCRDAETPLLTHAPFATITS